MGADLLLYAVPNAELTPDRVAELRELVFAMPPDDLIAQVDEIRPWLVEDMEDTSNLLEAARAVVIDAIDELVGCGGQRDVASLKLTGWPYAVLFTGGMSWGDDATDAQRFFEVLDAVPPVWEKLREWATEDAKVVTA